MRFDDPALAALAGRQFFAASRGQLIELGATDSWMRGNLRAGRWVRQHPGVYVLNTAPPRWETRAQAALLYAGDGAALSHLSAAYRHGVVSKPPRVVELIVPHGRTVVPQQGLRIYQRRQMPRTSPGPLRAVWLPGVAVDLADRARTPDEAVGFLCEAVRRGARPADLRREIMSRARLRGRGLLLDLVAEADAGVESPLEYRYGTDVERPHGLPVSTLQVREVLDGSWIRADRRYKGQGVRIELDGELAHPGGRTDRDVWRDNAVQVHGGEITLRYRWSHVVASPCRTAAQVAEALRVRGWSGTPRRCGDGCAVRTWSG
ncbi:hypothetical protein MF406_01230 [Georgenia sp. TF02-10]|uniref:hypothetical protein n=1 Tax=Georgenia sp. TF02-10 TaxID=2917725 RepID=UPI001FA7F6D8|nr:hypothetical protein [Georgenia sp. TF02-10]UNX54949.1 hypothetical protein MF406_01230 [Georgenia sp. TF02-10]